jgi:large subunit ribosomal protein L25
MFIEVNVQDMDIGDSLHIEAVKLPAGVVPVIKRNFTIATVAGRTAAEEETSTKPADATATAAAGTAAAPGAAAPAAGAAAPAAGAAKKEEPKKK